MQRHFAFLAILGILISGCQPSPPPGGDSSDTPREVAAVEQTKPPNNQGPAADERDSTQATPTASGSDYIPSLRQLTEPGCCVPPLWSPDGDQVRFVDKRPDLSSASAIYGVSINGGEVEMVSRVVGVYSPGDEYLAFPTPDNALMVQNQETGIRAIIPSEGRAVFFSPHNEQIAWQIIRRVGIYENRRSEISVADVNGRNARQLIAATGGSIVGWLDDETLLLLAGMPGKDANHRALFTLSTQDEERIDLIDEDRVVDAGIAPGGEWIWYVIAFSPQDPGNNGLWIVRRDGSERRQLAVFGAPQWRDASHLLVIPVETVNDSHLLLQVDAETGEMVQLFSPDSFSFKVQAGQWKVSPTGEHIVFLNAADGALWVFDLPPVE